MTYGSGNFYWERCHKNLVDFFGKPSLTEKSWWQDRKGVIHKPCGYDRGKGVCQMSILLQKHYLVKWSMKGEGVQKSPKNFPHGLWTTPKIKGELINRASSAGFALKISKQDDEDRSFPDVPLSIQCCSNRRKVESLFSKFMILTKNLDNFWNLNLSLLFEKGLEILQNQKAFLTLDIIIAV